LEVLRGYGLECSLTCGELLAYLSGPTYTGDRVTAEQVVSDDLLFLHEVAEACILKGMGYVVDESTATRAYPDTYRAHLKAMEVELLEAEKRGRLDHVAERCRDLESYVEDPLLPEDLRPVLAELAQRHCQQGRLGTRASE
jgi:hypothetical protein